ncbi:PREDICTED: meiosis-specific kinetochore protein [Gekko japonicus]|uniref:Meiosis-specific kinetochore protein n=1 Tax=Gekko japonicus TaxID=146911 RepID=A0ABM1LGD0_GEKJA|nr:PREDICTED: meiosis-specific kinetochore protein [Gekko japonicus]
MVVPDTVGRRNAPRQCLNLLSKRKRQLCAKRQIGSINAKTLPAIQENSKVDCFSAEQSVKLNYNENTGMNMNENISEMDSDTTQDFLHLNSGSRESLGSNETSSGMTLPTGVSDFLLECLDSSIEANTESGDRTNSYSSPETFRDDSDLEETCSRSKEYFGCKNSTLLNTSKALNIDKMPPLPSFSKIFGNTLEGRDASDTQFKHKRCCESTDVSTTVAGKQVHKILSSKEKTPKSNPSEILVLPPKQNKQLTLSVQKAAANENFSNTTSLHLGETVPAPPESSIFQYLHHPPEICCIIKASPEFRLMKVVQHPLSRQILSPPPGVSTDIITSDRNWIYSNNR